MAAARSLRRAPGHAGAIVLNPGTEREAYLPSKIAFRKAEPGDALRTLVPSAGGYGDPSDRDAGAVEEDVLDGYVSEATARRFYRSYGGQKA